MRRYRAHLLGGVFLTFGLLAAPLASGQAAEPAAGQGMAQAEQESNGSWAMYGHGYDNTRFSPLTQINTKNASHLRLAFSFQLGSLRSNESTPLVIGDTMYVSTSWGPKYIYALDAKTGQQRWKYEPDMPDDVLQYACCDVNNRGVT